MFSDLLQEYNLQGLLIGLATFLIIGLFHPLVIKGEYYFGVKCWWAFLLAGIVCTILSVYINKFLSRGKGSVKGGFQRILKNPANRSFF